MIDHPGDPVGPPSDTFNIIEYITYIYEEFRVEIGNPKQIKKCPNACFSFDIFRLKILCIYNVYVFYMKKFDFYVCTTSLNPAPFEYETYGKVYVEIYKRNRIVLYRARFVSQRKRAALTKTAIET